MKTKPLHVATGPVTARRVRPAQAGPVSEAWRRHHARLIELRERVVQETLELSGEAAEAMPAVGRSSADVASDFFDRELALGLLSFEQNALEEIDEALRRIHEGRYGVCERTGEPIPRRRLEAIPWARYTVEAQAEVERANETRPGA